ncbi:MAG TPA: hypothetical protein DHD79_04480 [Firmicutes bacterium]|nr:hypothetical protein [Bacillota bacterium]HAW70347.1 hypothetical protein [Bacillota bacterium]HAZ21098.1 hypothetical protein [Bacillota bacterium]HBE05483.1 hypothetical protein [Bacillota bacterium]HBG45145.1 hypothetical protein [Bacillota bacterium]
MYAVVLFTYNDQIDSEFIERFFVPCPKVVAICRFEDGALVTFKAPLDELEPELQVFLEPNGLFKATWGKILQHLSPPELPELEDLFETNRLRKSKAQKESPCGSNCPTCPQYRSHCRGCPVTPYYLGEDFIIGKS